MSATPKSFLTSTRVVPTPTKRLGQHFLVDAKLAEKIVVSAQIKPSDVVVEIGPGQGALTPFLLRQAKRVVAYEVDYRWVKRLNANLSSAKLEVKHADFLKASLPPVANKVVVVGNLPYYITSDVLFKLYKNAPQIRVATVMVQHEVAKRLVATANTSCYGKLSVTTQFFAKAELICVVPLTAFYPQPKVSSAVVRLTFHTTRYSQDHCVRFLNFVNLCFNMRRKTLLNNLHQIPPVLLNKALAHLRLNKKVRAQELSLLQFQKLFELVKPHLPLESTTLLRRWNLEGKNQRSLHPNQKLR